LGCLLQKGLNAGVSPVASCELNAGDHQNRKKPDDDPIDRDRLKMMPTQRATAAVGEAA
jgi:hypothetical protein